MKRKYNLGHLVTAGVVGTVVGLSTGLPITMTPKSSETNSEQAYSEFSREEPNQRYYIKTSAGGFSVAEFANRIEVNHPGMFGGVEDMTDIAKDGVLDIPGDERHQGLYNEIFERLQMRKIKEAHNDLLDN